MNRLEYYIQQYAFVYTFAILIAVLWSQGLLNISYNLNRTIGWAFDLANFQFWTPAIKSVFALIYSIGYFWHYRKQVSGRTMFIILNLIFHTWTAMVGGAVVIGILTLLISLICFVLVLLSKSPVE